MLVAFAWLLALLQFLPAFVSLDLFFRYMDVSPIGLPDRVRRYGLIYTALAMVWAVGTGWGQLQLAGPWGLVPGLLNVVPWWLLWRFGLRKQLTHLFKDDGGHPVHTEKPDP